MKAIMYHYVRPFNPDLPGLNHLHIDDFRKQLDYFEENYGFVSKADFEKAFVTGDIPEGVVLTFDDGLKCHYDYVLPELKSRGLWGFFFITTGIYQTNDLLGVHKIHILLGAIDHKKIYDQLHEIVTPEMLSDKGMDGFTTSYSLITDDNEYSMEVKRTLNFYIAYEFRSRIIDQLLELNNLSHYNNVADFYVNHAEIQSLNEAGMIVGSHTVNHFVMSKLNVEDQALEIKESMKYLENICPDIPYRSFCYPYGGPHTFTNETEAVLAANDFKLAFSLDNVDIIKSNISNQPFALSRYDCNAYPYGQVRKVMISK